MPCIKPFTIRGYCRLLRSSRLSMIKLHGWRQIGQRGYASQVHGTSKSSGDLPWAIGALVVTVPTTWYLLQNGPSSDHAHHGQHGSHGDEHGKHYKAEKSENSSEDKGVEGSSNEIRGKDVVSTPVTSDKEASDNEPEDSKTLDEEKLDQSRGDKDTASQSAGGEDVQSGKQEGLSNTDTKFATDITKNHEESQKPEGAPETAKLKGSVDPNRT